MMPKHALIVGATSGIGHALRQRFNTAGVAVSSVGRRAPAHVPGWHQAVDLCATDWRSVLKEASGAVGSPVDTLVFVAGTAVFGRVLDIPTQDAREVFELNFWSPRAAALEAARYWLDLKRRGIFIVVLSVAARRAIPLESYYCASKAAMASFIWSLQLEHAGDGLEFLAIYPGILNTGFVQKSRWVGMAPPADRPAGKSADEVAEEIIRLLEKPRRNVILGWRERIVDILDRVNPAIYDRWLLRRRIDAPPFSSC
jgi:short-subunit dehydrogenase